MKKRAKKKPVGYTGYIKFPLVGAETYHEYMETAEFYGDFAIIERREKIFSKPRYYKVSIWVKLKGTDEYSVMDVDFKEPATDEQLAKILFQLGNEEANNVKSSGSEVDLKNSFYKISLKKD